MARYFSGVAGNRLSVGDVPAIDITGLALTVAAWVNPDVVATDGGILGKTDATSNTQYFLRHMASSKVRFAAGDANVNTEFVDSLTSLSIGAWQHLAGVKEGTGAVAMRIYLNGVLDNSNTGSFTMGQNSQPLFLGAMNAGYAHMNGSLAEVGIWDAVLLPSEIASLAKGFSPLLVRPGSLAAYWPLYGNANPEPELINGNLATVVGTVPRATISPRIITPSPAIYTPM